jgi:hypothetical protein
VICAPEGFNLAWSTSMPLLAALCAPVTLRWGPVMPMNLLALLTPALAALFAFMLIRRLLHGHG